MGTDQQKDVAQVRLAARPCPLSQSELAPVWLLGGVALESVFGLLVHCAVVEPGAREVLIAPDRDERKLFVVLRGALDVYLDAELIEPVARLSTGQSAGELALIDARPASAYVVTAEPSRLLVVDEGTFWRLVAASHPFAVNLLTQLAQRMRANNQQLSATVQHRRLLEREANTDALTGVHNRRWLEQRLPRLVARHRRAGRALSLMLVDIDHFKRFNDDFGHATGDLVLAKVAQAIAAQVRPTDIVARYGGEEFVVVLPETPSDGARVAAERLRQRIADMRLESVSRAVTISIGVATLSAPDGVTLGSDVQTVVSPHVDADVHALLEQADRKLYLAKARGRDRVEL